MPTPWAPIQHKGMSCCCNHWDARTCLTSRVPPGYAPAFPVKEDDRCECCCHDRDQDEDEGYADEYCS